VLYKKHTISFKAGGLEKRRQTLMNSMKRIFERTVDTVKSPPAKEAARGATPAAMKPRMNPQRGKQKKEGDNFTPFQANEDDRPSDDDTNSNIFACGRASCKGACASPCVQCKAKHAPTKCEFRSCSKCCKGENGKQCDGHDLRRTKKKNEQAEQKQNENDVNEFGLQNEKPSGKKDPEESARDGKKAHDFDVFCESFGVVVEMSKEEKENKIKETEMFVRFVLKNDENNKERSKDMEFVLKSDEKNKEKLKDIEKQIVRLIGGQQEVTLTWKRFLEEQMQMRRQIEKEMRDMRDMEKEMRRMIEEITGKQKMWTQEQTEAKRMQQEKREENKQQENRGKRSSQGPQAQQWRQQQWQRNQQQQWGNPGKHKWPHHQQLRQNVQHHQVGWQMQQQWQHAMWQQQLQHLQFVRQQQQAQWSRHMQWQGRNEHRLQKQEQESVKQARETEAQQAQARMKQ